MHRDISYNNVLCDQNWKCKIIDYGLVGCISMSHYSILGTESFADIAVLEDNKKW